MLLFPKLNLETETVLVRALHEKLTAILGSHQNADLLKFRQSPMARSCHGHSAREEMPLWNLIFSRVCREP